MEQSSVDYKKALDNLGGDTDLYKELLNCWFGETPLNKDILDGFIAKNAFPDAASYVHRIKGAAGSLGAMPLFKAAQKVEDILRGKSAENLQFSLQTLYTAYEHANTEFKKLQSNL